MIKALLFDFGGVLVRTEDWSPRQRWEKRLGLAERALDAAVFNSEVARRASRGEGTVEEVWADVARAFNLEAAQLEECRRDFWSGDRLDTELVALIQALRPKYKTAILSNAWSDARENFTRLFGLDQAFDQMIISAEEGITKPDPRAYRRAAERLGVRPEESVFVDDFIENVEGARAVGMQAIHYRPGLEVAGELRRLGVEVPAAGDGSREAQRGSR
jgi:putative hydrolase of the HAD superfamily